MVHWSRKQLVFSLLGGAAVFSLRFWIDGCLAKQQKQREIARNRGQSAKHERADGKILDGSDQIRVRLRAISGHKSGFC